MNGKTTFFLIFASCLMLIPQYLSGRQVTVSDYERADALRETFRDKVLHRADEITWIGDTRHLWYRQSTREGHEFIRVDAESAEKRPAFDHVRLADALSAGRDTAWTPEKLPFDRFRYVGGEQGIEVRIGDSLFTCSLAAYTCGAEVAEERRGGRSSGSGDDQRVSSPDGQWEAFVRNHNVAVRRDGSDETIMLSTDGTEGSAYEAESFAWSPDSRKLAAYRVTPGYDRQIHYVETSPEDQLQPRHRQRRYLKPGDVLDVEHPVLFDLERRTRVEVDRTLFPNAYRQSSLNWWEDGRGFYFEYNERGHQNYRIIEVDGETGEARALVDEQPDLFFSYYSMLWRHYTDNGREILWASERDGWNHIYLYDGMKGELKNQVTRGEWVVQEVDSVDSEKRQIWFQASGYDEDQDPYFHHYFRVNFDGSGLTRLTEADGHHEVSWSSDMEYYVDTWSKVDQAPVSVLRRTGEEEPVMVLEEADPAPLLQAGWQAPEPFVAKGRDGETDIWGVIIRPTDFDSTRSWPVIEYIYAGPHSSFVPKSFSSYSHMMSMAELGFVVVQIDGMGTANRSKAFHNVAWKNLKDAGFPDRILWHRAAAERYPWYDIDKVGIYGTSAGGQNSTGALLFHPDFYKVAVSAVGCHDNRMDKISWNEQWMGWPVGPQYAESSNVEHAHRLQGDLLLIVGELDTNVDPASTYQLADRLIRAGKDFDLLVIPGAGHTSGGVLGERMRRDFFVEHILGVDPPHWNSIGTGDGQVAGGGDPSGN